MADGSDPGAGWWVAAGRNPRLFFLPIDARAAVPLPLLFLSPSLTTLVLVLASMVAFGVMAMYGLTLPNALRALRAKLRGRRIYARPWHYQRRFRARGF